MESAHELHDEDREHAWEEVFESVCVLHPQSIAIPHSIQSLNHGISTSHSITLHRTPSHSMAINHTPSHSIAIHHNLWQQQAHRLNTQHGSNPAAAAGFEQVLGWLCARERGTWRCADADWQEDGVGEFELLRRRRGLHRGKQSVSDAGSG